MQLKQIILYIFLSSCAIGFLSLPSCSHEPFPLIEDPGDDIDTMKVDTTKIEIDTSGIKCDSNIVYFDKDVLPILKQNCAIVDCHGGGSSEDGVNLENYENVIATGEIKPFNVTDSKFYRVITTNKPSDVMPPPPASRLSSSQINIISKWIKQGALDEKCNSNWGLQLGCNKISTTYSGFVKKLLQDNCIGCHKGSNPQGDIGLDTYEKVKVVAENGKLIGSINWASAYVRMPYNSEQLDTCSINKIKFWIDNGSKND